MNIKRRNTYVRNLQKKERLHYDEDEMQHERPAVTSAHADVGNVGGEFELDLQPDVDQVGDSKH